VGAKVGARVGAGVGARVGAGVGTTGDGVAKYWSQSSERPFIVRVRRTRAIREEGMHGLGEHTECESNRGGYHSKHAWHSGSGQRLIYVRCANAAGTLITNSEQRSLTPECYYGIPMFFCSCRPNEGWFCRQERPAKNILCLCQNISPCKF